MIIDSVFGFKNSYSLQNKKDFTKKKAREDFTKDIKTGDQAQIVFSVADFLFSKLLNVLTAGNTDK
jgi:hypothetical protein